VKEIRKLGHKASAVIAKALRQKDPGKIAKTLFGLKDRDYYFRFKRHPHSQEEITERLMQLAKQGAAQFDQARDADGKSALRILLTGGTGFVGKEVLWQAATDEAIAEIVVVIRPKQIRDRKTKEIIQTLSPVERGEMVLEGA